MHAPDQKGGRVDTVPIFPNVKLFETRDELLIGTREEVPRTLNAGSPVVHLCWIKRRRHVGFSFEGLCTKNSPN